MTATCEWIINRKRIDPWAEPGERFRSVCGEPAVAQTNCGAACRKHVEAHRRHGDTVTPIAERQP